MSMRATLVIPTYNRARYLERALHALEAQDASGRFDVIVVDDGSADDTGAVLSRPWALQLTALRQENAGPAAARNAAIRSATGEVVVFVDDDVIAAPDLVRRHLEAQAEGPAVVIGRIAMPEGRRQPAWAEWEGRSLQRQYDLMTRGVFTPTPRQFYTANASVPREAALRAGLFDPAFRRAEDVEFAYRLADFGLPFRFEPEAVVVHDTPRSLDAWLRVARQYGEYDIVMWRDKGRAHILRNIAEERRFYRPLPVRALTRVVAGRASLAAVVAGAGSTAIRALGAVGARSGALAACSAVFNALYMDAACRTFGERRAFWRAIDAEADAAAALEASAEAV